MLIRMRAAGRRTAVALVAMMAFIAGPTGAAAAQRLVVYAVNYPLQYFAQRLGGDLVEAVFPAPTDIDPAFWQPPANTVADYQQADLILLNGAGYAKWIERVSLPRRKTVDTSLGFSEGYIQTEGLVTHSHGREGDHSHTGTAFTTWLDLGQAVKQAQAVRAALMSLRPQQGPVFAANYKALERDLLALDARLKAIVAADPGRPLLGSHPVYQYLARRYGINLASVMWEPDEVPNDDQWRGVAELLARHPAAWMLWEGEPDAESRRRLRERGVDSVVFDPCGNRPEAGDFISVMSTNVANLERVYR